MGCGRILAIPREIPAPGTFLQAEKPPTSSAPCFRLKFCLFLAWRRCPRRRFSLQLAAAEARASAMKYQEHVFVRREEGTGSFDINFSKLSDDPVTTVASPKRCDFENAETLRFSFRPKKIAAIFSAIFWGAFSDFWRTTCNFALCDLKNAANFCDCVFWDAKVTTIRLTRRKVIFPSFEAAGRHCRPNYSSQILRTYPTFSQLLDLFFAPTCSHESQCTRERDRERERET